MVKSAELASASAGSAPAVLLLALGQMDTADGTRTHTSRSKVGYSAIRPQRWTLAAQENARATLRFQKPS